MLTECETISIKDAKNALSGLRAKISERVVAKNYCPTIEQKEELQFEIEQLLGEMWEFERIIEPKESENSLESFELLGLF